MEIISLEKVQTYIVIISLIYNAFYRFIWVCKVDKKINNSNSLY